METEALQTCSHGCTDASPSLDVHSFNHTCYPPNPPQDRCLLRSLADPLTFRPGAPGQDDLELLLAAASTTDCKVPTVGSEPPRAQVSLGNRTA